MHDAYKYKEKYNLDRKFNVLLVFDGMFVYMINNKKFTQMVTELFIRTRKMYLYFFITKSCFPVPKDVRVNCTLFFYETFKQIRASANYTYSLIRYCL